MNSICVVRKILEKVVKFLMFNEYFLIIIYKTFIINFLYFNIYIRGF